MASFGLQGTEKTQLGEAQLRAAATSLTGMDDFSAPQEQMSVSLSAKLPD